MNRLWVKLSAGFVLVAMTGVAVMALLVVWATRQAFGTYVSQGIQRQTTQIAAALADYYAQRRSWTGVDELLDATINPMESMMRRMMGRGWGGPWMGGRLSGPADSILLTDATGVILYSTDPMAGQPGQRASAEILGQGTPITLEGRTVGYLLTNPRHASTLGDLESSFLASVNVAVLVAGLLALAVGVGASLVIAQRVTAPIASMTRAARAIAQGDLSQRVATASSDEVGELALAFNQMAANLAHAEELRRNLVADVAHELRTPLAVLQADLEAIQDGVYQPTPEHIATLRSEVSHLSRLVSDLHELALAEAGQLTLEKRPTDIATLVQRVVETMQSTAHPRQLTLTATILSPIPPLTIDPDRIEQALRNLVGNALRYTPAGGRISVEVEMGAFPHSNRPAVVLRVRDTGPGIAPEDLPYIFDRFYRGEKSRARSTGGSGLGLAIVRQLVEAHGGSVWVDSVVGQGSTFSVALPLG